MIAITTSNSISVNPNRSLVFLKLNIFTFIKMVRSNNLTACASTNVSMSRKQWTMIVLAVLLAGFSIYLNKDWFSKDGIHIFHRSRPSRGFFRRGRPAPDSGAVNPVTFGFDRKLKLKSVKVIPVSDVETNKYPHPIWQMVSESNSVPVKDFTYGGYIPGMHPAVKGALADPLEPGVNYRLFVETADFKGQHDFVPVEKTPSN